MPPEVKNSGGENVLIGFVILIINKLAQSHGDIK